MYRLNLSETILFAFGIIAVLPTLLRPEDYTTEDKSRAAPIPGICIGIGPIPAFLMASESVKYLILVPILLFVHYFHKIVF